LPRPFHMSLIYILKSSSSLYISLQSGLSQSSVQINILQVILIYRICATCPSHLSSDFKISDTGTGIFKKIMQNYCKFITLVSTKQQNRCC
jgi:translation initiation factor 2 beta subunit (eIF-2beta)/eIF-5